MPTHRLIITIDNDEVNDEQAIQNALQQLADLFILLPSEDKVSFKLVREGDRSGLNILLPKLEGRMGEHYQNKKATFKELEACGRIRRK